MKYILNVTKITFCKVFLSKTLRPISANIFNQNRATFLSKRASRPPQTSVEKENPELDELFEFHFVFEIKNRKKTVILNYVLNQSRPPQTSVEKENPELEERFEIKNRKKIVILNY